MTSTLLKVCWDFVRLAVPKLQALSKGRLKNSDVVVCLGAIVIAILIIKWPCIALEKQTIWILLVAILVLLYALIGRKKLKYPQLFHHESCVFISLLTLSLIGMCFALGVSYLSETFRENEKGIYVARFHGDCKDLHCETIICEINELKTQLPGNWNPKKLKKEIGTFGGDIGKFHNKAKKIGLEKGAALVIWGTIVKVEGNNESGPVYYGLSIAKKEVPIANEVSFRGIDRFDMRSLGREINFITRIMVALVVWDDAKSQEAIDVQKIEASLGMLSEAENLMNKPKHDKCSLYNDFQILFTKGLMFFDLGNFEYSLDHFRRGLKTLQNVRYQFDKGTYYRGKVEEYIPKVQFNIGLSYLLLKEYSKAYEVLGALIEDLRKILYQDIPKEDQLKITRLMSEAYYHLGYMKHLEANAKSDINELGKAIGLYEKSVNLDPSYPENHWGYYGLGTAYLSKRDYKQAQDSFVKAIEILSKFEKRLVGDYLTPCWSGTRVSLKREKIQKRSIVLYRTERKRLAEFWRATPLLAWQDQKRLFSKFLKVIEMVAA